MKKIFATLALCTLVSSAAIADPTFTVTKRENCGSLTCIHGTMALDSSYPTNGEAITASKFPLHTVDVLLAGSKGYIFEYDRANAKLKAFQSAGFTPAGTVAAPTFTATGTDYEAESGSDIKGSANTDSENADAASLPTNGAIMLAATTFTALAGTMTPTVQTDAARNIGIFITNDSGGALDLFEGVTTFACSGTYKGAAQSENITITSTAGNKSVGNAPNYRYKYGVKPYDSLTSCTITNAPAGTLKGSIGFGSKIGLHNNLKTPAEADVVKITKNAANLSPSSIVDTTNMTVNLGALSDGDDFQIVHGTASGDSGTNSAPSFTGTAVSAGAVTEVSNGTNLSGVTGVPFFVMGH